MPDNGGYPEYLDDQMERLRAIVAHPGKVRGPGALLETSNRFGGLAQVWKDLEEEQGRVKCWYDPQYGWWVDPT